MKNLAMLVGAFLICLTTSSAFGQEETVVNKTTRSIKKEVRFEDENGSKKLTIVSEEAGVRTEEVFFGAAAELKLAELMPEVESAESMEAKKVHFEEKSEGKRVTITTNVDGVEVVRLYEGKEADEKLQELQIESGDESLEDGDEIEVKKKGVMKFKKSRK